VSGFKLTKLSGTKCPIYTCQTYDPITHCLTYT
jgi:hypothetical protein